LDEIFKAITQLPKLIGDLIRQSPIGHGLSKVSRIILFLNDRNAYLGDILLWVIEVSE
jgi:hypothetical protein